MDICFTGHRPNKLGGYDWCSTKNKRIIEELSTEIENIIKYNEGNNFHFICGGALGIDQMAFDICKKFRDLYDNITIEIAIPFSQQFCKWNFEDVKRYKIQKSQADKCTYVDRIDKYKINVYEEDIYYPAKMQKRNEYMVDNSDIVVVVWNGIKKGGTWNCVRYAEKLHKNIYKINPS